MGILDSKVAVITGAGQRIGKACADVFVREGAHVLAVDTAAPKTTSQPNSEAASCPSTLT
jgi:NAD(P)-dependent dehydrogenase (short-subunit alcohol dehydrogenase family)